MKELELTHEVKKRLNFIHRTWLRMGSLTLPLCLGCISLEWADNCIGQPEPSRGNLPSRPMKVKISLRTIPGFSRQSFNVNRERTL